MRKKVVAMGLAAMMARVWRLAAQEDLPHQLQQQEAQQRQLQQLRLHLLKKAKKKKQREMVKDM